MLLSFTQRHPANGTRVFVRWPQISRPKLLAKWEKRKSLKEWGHFESFRYELGTPVTRPPNRYYSAAGCWG